VKILFLARSTLFSQPGGDTRQIEQTSRALRSHGVEVTLRLHGEKIDFDDCDLVHFFNLGRPADIVYALNLIHKPLVVSSIWVDYSEYDKLRNPLLFRLFGRYGMEYLKTIARGVRNTDVFPGLSYLFLGQRRSLMRLLRHADLVITSSQSEERRIKTYLSRDINTRILPLGLEKAFLSGNPENQSRSGVLSVGRIEGLKNQLNLIRAAKNAYWTLKLVGKVAENQPEYYKKCLSEAGQNVSFAGWKDTPELILEYQNARVFALTSYFETFGLVALEALSQGCNLVLADRPDMNEIFRGRALFCNPDDPSDIRRKIEMALTLPPHHFNQKEQNEANWLTISVKLLSIYEDLTGLKV
jgi:glycosyltransferase involved in cell wall biosynthesis